jgi:hypothetical protein
VNDTEIKIIKQLNEFLPEDKITWWGEGEWVDEPDTLKFEYKGYTCLISRMGIREPYAKEIHIFGGYLCGYVVMTDKHPLFGKFNDELIYELDCHGGVTFNEKGESAPHLIGFDCAHSGDIVPSPEKLYKNDPSFVDMRTRLEEMLKKLNLDSCRIFNKSYRNINFCIGECKGLVDQLIVLEKNEN